MIIIFAANLNNNKKKTIPGTKQQNEPGLVQLG